MRPAMQFFTIAAIGLLVGPLQAEQVAVDGSEIKFDSAITVEVGDQQVDMVVTGTALREKFFVNVYAIASYVQKGSEIKNAEALAQADVPKRLHLILERDLAGEKMAEAVNESITANYSPAEFEAELKTLLDFIKADAIAKGDHVRLTHIPGKGLDCEILGKNSRAIRIENMKLSRAVWDIYFGKRNIGVAIKRNLASRL